MIPLFWGVPLDLRLIYDISKGSLYLVHKYIFVSFFL